MQLLDTDPQYLPGAWDAGWALDLHTQAGSPGAGYVRTPIGESLYRLKYLNDYSQIEILAHTAARFIAERFQSEFTIDVIVPIPPSDQSRPRQPVSEVGRAIGEILGIPVDESYLVKSKPTPKLKDITDYDERLTLLRDAFRVDLRYARRVVLLFDDLYRSGATLGTATRVIRYAGLARAILVLALTKTRVRR